MDIHKHCANCRLLLYPVLGVWFSTSHTHSWVKKLCNVKAAWSGQTPCETVFRWTHLDYHISDGTNSYFLPKWVWKGSEQTRTEIKRTKLISNWWFSSNLISLLMSSWYRRESKRTRLRFLLQLHLQYAVELHFPLKVLLAEFVLIDYCSSQANWCDIQSWCIFESHTHTHTP